MSYNEKIGDVIEKLKNIEYYLNCIIANHVSPKETGFFDNVILNSSIVPFGAKLKIIKTICECKEQKYDFRNLHKLNAIRNLFAHESSYWDVSGEETLTKMDELKSDGKYIPAVFNDKYEEFLSIFKQEFNNVIKLNENLIKNSKCQNQ